MSIEFAGTVEKCSVKLSKGHKIVGSLLSVIGFFWLSKKLGWIPHETSWMPHEAHGSPVFWPLVVIAVGLLIIFGPGVRSKKHSE